MTDIEVWKTAVYDGEVYEELYKVSNLGRILSLNYNHTGKPGLMNPGTDTNGYFYVNLWKNRKPKLCSVHRLVAQTFLPNPENKPFINHKIEGDEGKTMNMVIFNEDGTINEEKTTIEWVTAKENNDYGTHNERVAKANTNGKQSKPVLQLSLTGELIREWPSTMEIQRQLGYNNANISACCLGKRKSAYGFRWEYK